MALQIREQDSQADQSLNQFGHVCQNYMQLQSSQPDRAELYLVMFFPPALSSCSAPWGKFWGGRGDLRVLNHVVYYIFHVHWFSEFICDSHFLCLKVIIFPL